MYNFNIFVNTATNANADAEGSAIALPVLSYRRAKKVTKKKKIWFAEENSTLNLFTLEFVNGLFYVYSFIWKCTLLQ